MYAACHTHHQEDSAPWAAPYASTHVLGCAPYGLDAVAAHPGLTSRELEVFTWIVRGHTNSQIANELGVVEDTVKSHVKNILMKLGVSSRSKAVAAGLQLGLVKLDGS